MQKEKTGVAGLDKMLGGGLPQGRSVLVSGSCGTGKTILAYHFAGHGLAEGIPTVFVTLEQSKDKVMADAGKIGIPLKKYLESGKLALIGGSVGTLRYYKLRTKAKLDDMLDELRDVVQQSKARRVVIDSVNLFTLLFDTDMERRLAFASLVAQLEELNCTTLMTCEIPEGEKHLSWYGFEDFVADGVILLRRIPCDSCMERAVSVIKLRGNEHDTQERPLSITSKGLIIYTDKEPAHTKFGLHTDS
ncbi:AAA family ATPase [Candidatus Woesearchaeota archaeon]|nr:AAA family ATPase [Candidatus Woesearchaeota archaeon]